MSSDGQPSKKRKLGRAWRPIHVRRVVMQIRRGNVDINPKTPPTTPAIPGRLVMNDLSRAGFAFFCKEALDIETEVTVTLPPINSMGKAITVHGIVVYCQHHDMNTHVICDDPLPYRAGVRVQFKGIPEENDYKKYYEEFWAILHPGQAAA